VEPVQQGLHFDGAPATGATRSGLTPPATGAAEWILALLSPILSAISSRTISCSSKTLTKNRRSTCGCEKTLQVVPDGSPDDG
jgi:hypothetical protein